jgi:2,5-diamino-6-(ribosylamino)-4(3H)-pyrimidinone 5'-phosphate reductase
VWRHFDHAADQGPGPVEVAEVYRDLRLPEPPGDRPLVLVNMIATLDGKAVVGPAGSTWQLGTATDHALFKQLRGSADAQIMGAGVVRSDDPPPPRPPLEEQRRREREGLRPLPLSVIVSGQAAIPETARLLNSPGERPLVVVTGSAPAEKVASLAERAEVLVAGEARLDAPAMMRHLRQVLGVQVLYAIGGPTLNGTLLQARAIDEWFMTLAPRLHGGSGLPTLVEGAVGRGLVGAHLVSLYQDADELYLRYRLTS